MHKENKAVSGKVFLVDAPAYIDSDDWAYGAYEELGEKASKIAAKPPAEPAEDHHAHKYA